MRNEAKKRLLDVRDACDAISEFVAGKTFADYEADRLLRSAVERPFEVIGEALKKAGSLEPPLVARIPDLQRIVGLRNRLIHGYGNLDAELLWDVVQSKLGPLQAQVSAVLDSDAD